MSAFLVADETINSIVSWLEREMTRSPRLSEKVTSYFREHGIAVDEWQADLALNMFALNMAGVEDRYGTGEAAAFRELTFTYKPVLPPLDI